MANLPLVLSVALGALARVAHSQAIIGDGAVILGVSAAGFLNIPYAPTGGLVNLPADDPRGLGIVGLRNPAGDITALEEGFPSEGWGCGIRNGGPDADFLDECAAQSSFAPDGELFNVEVSSFDADDDYLDATSSVLCGASQLLYVRHQFRPGNRRPGCEGAYEIKVTIENRACEAVADVIYRRVLDWDIDPTPFSELLTIQGTGVDDFFEFATNDGFCNPRPSTDCDNDYGFEPDAVDFGPFDQGATFQINVGQLEFGERAIFRMFYGFFETEAQALECTDGAKMNLFSLGQDEDQVNTFLFGFRNALSKAIVDSDSFECVSADPAVPPPPPPETEFEVAEDALDELTPPGTPPPAVEFATLTVEDAPADDGSDGLATPEEKRAANSGAGSGAAPSPA